jgi:hypothetical protein
MHRHAKLSKTQLNPIQSSQRLPSFNPYIHPSIHPSVHPQLASAFADKSLFFCINIRPSINAVKMYNPPQMLIFFFFPFGNLQAKNAFSCKKIREQGPREITFLMLDSSSSQTQQ